MLAATHSGDSALGGSRFAAAAPALRYGGTSDFVTSLEPIYSVRALEMEAEWMRDDRWVDYTGVAFSAAQQWEYVRSPVAAGSARAQASGFGDRDGGHEGWTAETFLTKTNDFVRDGCTRNEVEAQLLLMNEVLAIRLFTGPGYQPINEFLREMATLTVAMRRRVARCREVTYSSTCFHLCNGLRKLARASQVPGMLYRVVRGKLPQGFEEKKDAHGLLTVVEPGCMSSSLDESVVDHYRDKNGGHDVVWHIRSKPETEDAFHCGADVSLLSQFPKEKEITFPPYTMLVIEKGASGSPDIKDVARPEGGHYRQITVVPHFV
jgi:hypothetical protein